MKYSIGLLFIDLFSYEKITGSIMVINSRGVSEQIKKEIRPLLEKEAFTKFTTRKAWRFINDTVHEIDIQSLGSYNAQRLNTSSFSFSIYIGISFLAVSKYPWFESQHSEIPPPTAFVAHKTLRKTIIQPELPRPDIWYVDPEGRYLAKTISDARSSFIDQGFPWLEKFSDKKTALKSFESKPDTVHQPGIMDEQYGGKVGSLGRARIASALALEIGKKERAIRIWNKFLKNPYYRSLEEIRKEAQQNIHWIEENV